MQRRAQISSFQALRAGAAWMVLLYHLQPQRWPSAYQAVQVFFVLAGFLNYYHPADRWHDSSDFFRETLRKLGQKVAKLWPLLIFTVTASFLALLLGWPEFLANFRFSAQASLLGLNNWQQIMQGESYFQSFGYLKPLTHLWALAVEWQWLIMALLILNPCRQILKRYQQMLLLLLLSLLSLAYAFWIFDPNQLSFFYYDSFARFYAYAWGGLAALLSARRAPLRLRRQWVLTALARVKEGLMLLLLLGCLLLTVFDWGIWGLHYGLVLMAALLAILLALLRYDRSWLSRFLGWPIWNYFAQRSYALYLIHYPLIRFAEKVLANQDLRPWAFEGALILLTILLSDGLYRCQVALKNRSLKRLAFSLLLSLMVLLFVFPYQIFGDTEAAQRLQRLQKQIEEQEERLESQASVQAPKPSSPTARTEASSPVSSASLAEPDADWPEAWQGLAAKFKELEVYEDLNLDPTLYKQYRDHLVGALIGDSVSVIASYQIPDYLPELLIDAKSLRQWPEAAERLRALREEHEEEFDFWILALGTNGDILSSDIEAAYQAAEGKPFLVVNIILPFPGQEAERNRVLENFVKSHKNCYLVNWHQLAKTRAEFFQEDNIHPSELGSKAYAQILCQALIHLCEEGVLTP